MTYDRAKLCFEVTFSLMSPSKILTSQMTTTKQVISRRAKKENDGKMYKQENSTYKAKQLFFHWLCFHERFSRSLSE